MPDLPERADIDQLRRKARELLRAAIAGEPEALVRLHAVSGRPTLGPLAPSSVRASEESWSGPRTPAVQALALPWSPLPAYYCGQG